LWYNQRKERLLLNKEERWMLLWRLILKVKAKRI